MFIGLQAPKKEAFALRTRMLQSKQGIGEEKCASEVNKPKKFTKGEGLTVDNKLSASCHHLKLLRAGV